MTPGGFGDIEACTLDDKAALLERYILSEIEVSEQPWTSRDGTKTVHNTVYRLKGTEIMVKDPATEHVLIGRVLDALIDKARAHDAWD